MRQATIYIDSEALQYNLNRVKQLAPHSQIVSMVKANAYGHGVQDCLAAAAGYGRHYGGGCHVWPGGRCLRGPHRHYAGQ